MSKLDKIGYIIKDTGEEISKEIYETIVKEENRKRYIVLQELFKNNTITKDELLELMRMIKSNSNGEIYYDDFYKVNMNKPKPDKISKAEYGGFFQLLNFLSYSNTIAHRNGKSVKLKDMAEYLNFDNDRSLKRFLKKLQENTMLAFINLGGIDYLIINPTYAQRKMRLNYTVFKLFQNDLVEYLDKYQIKLLELEEDDFEINSITAVESSI